MEKLTPMMQQYMKIKEKYMDCILLFRLGDFYEMFFDDAKIAHEVLDIALTGRECGLKERAPMAGVPHHAADTYIAKLVLAGYKVAVCEQVEDPKDVKGIVKRAVVRIITPGTVDTDQIDAKKNNYIVAYQKEKNHFGLAVTDLSTGFFSVTLLEDEVALLDELARLAPKEIITPIENGVEDIIKEEFLVAPSVFDPWAFDLQTAKNALLSHFDTHSLDVFGLFEDITISVAGGLLAYLHHTQQGQIIHLKKITRYYPKEFMHIDKNTRRHLEITETLWEQKRKGSLLWVLDYTKTSMGARKLHTWLSEPLLDKEHIIQRLDTVEEFAEDPLYRNDIKELLDPILDMERLISKITYKTANGRDLLSLAKSMAQLPALKELLQSLTSLLGQELTQGLDTLSDIETVLQTALVEEPPVSVREGNIFQNGYNETLDDYRNAKEHGNQWLNELEERERTATDIKNLRIKYNRVFGYFIEVTKSNLGNVPTHYYRKQTLANSERYTIDELQQIEEMILGADEKIIELEYELFHHLLEYLSENIQRIQETANTLAIIDVLQSFGEAADRHEYVKPTITDKNEICIDENRHPVVEQFSSRFVPNDVEIGQADQQLLVLTGPNMSGKSTYMRQVALTVLMAQCGSFVPAKKAEIGIVDRIFTRIGASDNLAMGQSTFMVEMTEMAHILHHATPKSLLILDEIGRGTSTYDGLSIAWAILEYIATEKELQPKTFFATHYHELTELENQIEGVKNLSVAVLEQGDDIIFLHSIKKGAANRSYGIQVAELAGMPVEVTHRARDILTELLLNNKNDIDIQSMDKSKIAAEKSLISTFSMWEEKLLQIDIQSLSPLEVSLAVKKLQEEIIHKDI